MDSINYLRMSNPLTFDYSRRAVVKSHKILELPPQPPPTHPMDRLRVRNFKANPPRPRQLPSVDQVEQERLKKYGQRVDIDPEAFAERLMKMNVKLPNLGPDGEPIKDQTGRMVYKYYSYKDILASPLLRRFRQAQLNQRYAPSIVGAAYRDIYDEEEPDWEADHAMEHEILQSEQEEKKQEEEKKYDVSGIAGQAEKIGKMLGDHTKDTAEAEQFIAEYNRKDNTDRQFNILDFNIYNKKGKAAFLLILNELGGIEMSKGKILRAWIAFVTEEVGLQNFNLYQLARSFIEQGPAKFLANEDPLTDNMVIYFNPNVYKIMQNLIQSRSPQIMTGETLRKMTDPKACAFAVILCGHFKDVPLNVVIAAFLFYLKETKNYQRFDASKALDHFIDAGGVETWHTARQKKEGGIPISLIDEME